METGKRKRYILFAAGYAIYMFIYINIPTLLPESTELRTWARHSALLAAVIGGMILFWGFLSVLRSRLLRRTTLKSYVNLLTVLCCAGVVFMMSYCMADEVNNTPHETVGNDGRLIVSVKESEDSQRMYYCSRENIFLRRRLTDEEVRTKAESE